MVHIIAKQNSASKLIFWSSGLMVLKASMFSFVLLFSKASMKHVRLLMKPISSMGQEKLNDLRIVSMFDSK